MKHFRGDYNRIQDPENKIPENEPVFLLRGQDAFAPTVARLWAKMAEEAGLAEMAKIVYAGADEMDEWQRTVKSKLPNLPNKINEK